MRVAVMVQPIVEVEAGRRSAEPGDSEGGSDYRAFQVAGRDLLSPGFACLCPCAGRLVPRRLPAPGDGWSTGLFPVEHLVALGSTQWHHALVWGHEAEA